MPRATAAARISKETDKETDMAEEKNYLVVFAAPVPGKEAAFQQWYDEVHVPDILGLPGYSAAQRFEFAASHAGEPPQRFLAIYEVEGSIEAGKAAMAEGRAAGRIRMSDALDPASVAGWWFRPLTERKTAE